MSVSKLRHIVDLQLVQLVFSLLLLQCLHACIFLCNVQKSNNKNKNNNSGTQHDADESCSVRLGGYWVGSGFMSAVLVFVFN